MATSLRVTLLAGIAGIVSGLGLVPDAAAGVTIDELVLVERTRVSRTVFNYTYRAVVTNPAPVALTDVTAYLSIAVNSTPAPAGPDPAAGAVDPAGGQYVDMANAGTVLIDDTVTIGAIGANETLVSDDTFTIQQDRTFQLNPDLLAWEVGFAGSVTLEGIVTDQPIPNAEVLITVDRTDSGRPIIESGRPIIETYGTTADAEGRYSVDVDFVSGEDFVDITANGVATFAFVELRSIVGSAESLLDEAEETRASAQAPIRVNSGRFSPLDVTHVSTALASLAIRANNGSGFTNDADLAAAQALVDNEELLVTAATLKTVIDNVGIILPPGIGTTQDLLNNPNAFDAFLNFIQTNFPDEYQAAIDETIGDLNVDFVAADMPEQLYLSLVRGNPLRSDANVLTLDQNGSATHINSQGETTDADWEVDEGGALFVTLNNPPELEYTQYLEVPPGSGDYQQVRVVETLTSLTVVRIAVGVAADQVLLGSTLLRTYPDVGGVIPDETFSFPPMPSTGYLAYGSDGFLPYTTAQVAGQTYELSYYHQDNNSVGLNNTDRGGDLLTFNANGTGSTARRSFAFTWLIDLEGRLVVTFANGDQNIYTRHGQIDGGLVGLGVLVGRFGPAEAFASDNLGVRYTPAPVFDEATLLYGKFRSGFAIVEPNPLDIFGVPRFDFTFLDDGQGCSDRGTVVPFDWSINSAGYMQLQRFYDDPPVPYVQRSWQFIATVPGTLGTRYWVIENLEFDFDENGFTDPTTTPGRVNFYERIADVSENSAPEPNDDFAYTDKDLQVFVPILANDTDLEGDPIYLESATGSDLGGIVDYSYDSYGYFNGILYTPPAGVDNAVDSFSYDVRDGSCSYEPDARATVTIIIGEPEEGSEIGKGKRKGKGKGPLSRASRAR